MGEGSYIEKRHISLLGMRHTYCCLIYFGEGRSVEHDHR